MRAALAVLLVAAACGKDPKLDQAKAEVEAVAAAVEQQTRAGADPCPGFKTQGKPIHLEPSVPRKDPWGGAYTVECTGGGYEVASAGPDGKPGTKDDVRSASRALPR